MTHRLVAGALDFIRQALIFTHRPQLEIYSRHVFTVCETIESVVSGSIHTPSHHIHSNFQVSCRIAAHHTLWIRTLTLS